MEGVIARVAKDDTKTAAAFTAARAEQEKIIQLNQLRPAVCVAWLIDAASARGRSMQKAAVGGALADRKGWLRGIAMIKLSGDDAAWRATRIRIEQLAMRSGPKRNQLWPIETDHFGIRCVVIRDLKNFLKKQSYRSH